MNEDKFKSFAERAGKNNAEKEEILRALRAARDGSERDLHASVDRLMDLNRSPYRVLWWWCIIGAIIGLIVGGIQGLFFLTIISLIIGFLVVKINKK